MKKVFFIKAAKMILYFVIFICVLYFGRNHIAKFVLEKGVETVVGLQLNMESVDLSLSDSYIKIAHFKLFNAADFQDSTLIYMPVIFVDFNLSQILKGKIHFEEVRIFVKELFVIKNKEGALNLDSFRTLHVSDKEKEKQEQNKEDEQKKAPRDMHIDLLSLKIDRVVYKDYSKGKTPETNYYDIYIDESFENVENFKSVIRIIVVKALLNTDLSSHVEGLKDIVQSLSLSTVDVLGDTAIKTLEATKDALESGAKGLTNILKSPFGEKE